jgi:hypothetical protein
VNETTETIPSADAERMGRSNWAETGPRLRRDEPETAMRTMAVVMIDVDAEDALELAAAGDQEPVQALAPHRADKALGVGVRLGRLDRRSDDLDALAAEDLIEGPAELRVAIVD